MWIIKKVDGRNQYVAEPGRKKAYTIKRCARKFATYDAAKQDCCGNETPIQWEQSDAR